DRFVAGILRYQPGVAARAEESLNRCLVLDHRSDDVSVMRLVLLADYRPVTIGNVHLLHRISHHPDGEEDSKADHLAGKPHGAYRLWIGSHRVAGRHPLKHRHT